MIDRIGGFFKVSYEICESVASLAWKCVTIPFNGMKPAKEKFESMFSNTLSFFGIGKNIEDRDIIKSDGKPEGEFRLLEEENIKNAQTNEQIFESVVTNKQSKKQNEQNEQNDDFEDNLKYVHSELQPLVKNENLDDINYFEEKDVPDDKKKFDLENEKIFTNSYEDDDLDKLEYMKDPGNSNIKN